MSFLMKINIIGAGASEVSTYLKRKRGLKERVKRYLGKGFGKSMVLGFDYTLKEAKVKDKSIKFQIWEMAGQPRFRTVRSVHYYGSLGFLIFYKKNDRDSFDDAIQWFDEFKKHCGTPIRRFSKDQLVLIGIIQESESVTKEEGEKLAEQLGMSYYEMDLKNGKAIDELLYKMGEGYLWMINQCKTV